MKDRGKSAVILGFLYYYKIWSESESTIYDDKRILLSSAHSNGLQLDPSLSCLSIAFLQPHS